MQPLTPDEAKWGRALGLLERKESYWGMIRRNPRRAVEEVAGLLLVVVFIAVCVFLVGVM